MVDSWVVLIIIAIVVGIVCFFIPTYIAFSRNHHYKWIVFAINVILGASGVGWLIAFVWAIWPTNKSFADPLIGNPTGVGYRNAGHTLGEVRASAGLASVGTQKSYATESTSALDALDRLGALVDRGVITPEEFARKKTALLDQV